MKNLKEFVIEQMNIKESSDDSQTFEFDFTDIENGEDTVKSLKEYGDYVSGDDNKITVTLTADNCNDDKFDSVQDILQQAISAARKDTKNSSNDAYAQKTHKLEDTLGKMNDALDELQNRDESDDSDKNSEDDK